VDVRDGPVDDPDAARPARAQETGLSGTVTDATDAVLPGVTVTALHIAIGNSFVAVTDAAGACRISALRPDVYRATELRPRDTSSVVG
jgi:hypothetical protein